MSSSRRPLLSFACAVLLALQGCAHYVVNVEKANGQPAQDYRFNPQTTGDNTNSLFVCLAFSGGGTRAAALSYGVLEKLRNTRIIWKGVEKSLLDEVDCISSISGGSFTAAYYGLFGDRIFQDFRGRFLGADIQGALFWQLSNPVNWVRLASPYFSRIDLAAEYYDQALFEGKTFASLAEENHRPFIMLNATNLANGERFEFTQQEFDILMSDLNHYPIARAVAASSAFPFLLSPITLKNYPHTHFVLPMDYKSGLKDYDTDRRRYYWARNRATYAEESRLPYVHLMDGGLADNVGLRPIEAAYRRTSGFIRKLFNEGEVEKFVVIVVNAHTTAEDTISEDESPPSLRTVALKTATIAMENYSVETVEAMKDLRTERVQAQKNIAACQEKLDQLCAVCQKKLSRCEACQEKLDQCPALQKFRAKLEPYVIEVNFEALRDPNRRQYFLSLPTSFSLTKEQVQALIDVGPQLLVESPDYNMFIQSLTSP